MPKSQTISALIRRIDKINPNLRIPLPELAIPRDVYIFSRSSQQLPCLRKSTLTFRFFNLVFNLHGAGEALIADVRFKFKPGNALLVFPGQPRHYAIAQPQDILWLFIGFRLDSYATLQPLRSAIIRSSPAMLKILTVVLKDYIAARAASHPSPEGSVRLSMSLWLLLSQIASQNNPRPKGRHGQTPIAGNDLAMRVQNLALENPAVYCTSRRIARALGISTQSLNRRFQRLAGESLGLFLRQQRICRARDLLNTTPLSVKEIAAHCGFSSPSTFSRAFKQLLKSPPRRYRAQQK